MRRTKTRNSQREKSLYKKKHEKKNETFFSLCTRDVHVTRFSSLSLATLVKKKLNRRLRNRRRHETHLHPLFACYMNFSRASGLRNRGYYDARQPCKSQTGNTNGFGRRPRQSVTNDARSLDARANYMRHV